MLVVTGRWRVIAAAAITVGLLVAVTSLWFGADIWLEYIRKVTPQQHWLLDKAGELGWPFVSSAFVNARLVGLSPALAWVSAGRLVVLCSRGGDLGLLAGP